MAIGIENMVECTLEKADDFLKVRETLTRIGVASRKDSAAIAITLRRVKLKL